MTPPPDPPALELSKADPEIHTWRTMRRLISRFRPVRGAALGVFGLLLVRAVLDLAPNFVIGESITLLSAAAGSGGPLPPRFVQLLWLLGGLMLARIVVWYASHVVATRVGQDLENTLRSDLFAHVARLRFRYHDENRSGKTIARSLRDMTKTRHFFSEVWFGYLQIILIVVVLLVIAFATHWWYGAMATTVFAVGIGGTLLAGGRIARMDRVVSDDYDKVTTALQENIAGARVVRAFGRQPSEAAKFGGRMDSFSGSWVSLAHFWTGVMPWVGNVYRMAVPGTLIIGVVLYSRGETEIGDMAAILLYLKVVHHRLRPLTRLVMMGQEAVASATRVFEVLDREEIIETPHLPPRLPATGGDLRIDDVRFGHVDGLHILRGVRLHVPAGGSLGILGPTGAGKSTLVQLLPRFYDPSEGRILLDGIDVRELDVRELRAQVGLVFQEPFLFSGTVSENVSFGSPGISQERIRECTTLAAAHEFVEQLPKGYDTIIGERGVSLSGGQRQRLTIARALAMNPRLLIFDDATAGVDAVTEKELFRGIRAASEGRTTLVISQRVTSVKWCDRIAVLDGGVVTAVGTHDDLVKSSPLYKEIHRHQELRRVAS